MQFWNSSFLHILNIETRGFLGNDLLKNHDNRDLYDIVGFEFSAKCIKTYAEDLRCLRLIVAHSFIGMDYMLFFHLEKWGD